MGTSRTSTAFPGAEQSRLPLSLGLSEGLWQGGKNGPHSQCVLAQTDAWRCQEFGFCMAWVWSVTFYRMATLAGRWQPWWHASSPSDGVI